MSIPRLLLAPTHRTGLANAVAGALAEIVTAHGRKVRYHHLGPLAPAACWDRWEGTAFLDPDLYDEDSLLRLYDVATRSAQLSLLSASHGVLDRPEGARWRPADVARMLDCPVVLVLDCRKWGAGIQALVAGVKAHLSSLNLAGALLSGVAGRDHYEVLREALAGEARPRRRVSLRGGWSGLGDARPRGLGPAARLRPFWRPSSARSTWAPCSNWRVSGGSSRRRTC